MIVSIPDLCIITYLYNCMRLHSEKKVIPSDSEVQGKIQLFHAFNFSISYESYLQYRVCFLLLSFKPDIDIKASNLLISSLNYLKEPSSANVASFANNVLLNSFFYGVTY